MAQASKENPEQRAGTMRKAEAIFVRDQPFMQLMFYGSKNLISPKLQGWESNTLDKHLARYLSIKP